MFIPIWTYAILVLFKYQYSHDAYKSPFNKSYIDVTSNGTLMTCIYPGDKSFKKGSPTLKYRLEQSSWPFDCHPSQSTCFALQSTMQLFGHVEIACIFGKPSNTTISFRPVDNKLAHYFRSEGESRRDLSNRISNPMA